jgi:hypothetical protein
MRLETCTKSWADWMAVFWVQQFFTLPVIFENIGMGDEPPRRRLPTEAVDQLGEFTFRVPIVSYRLENGRSFIETDLVDDCACHPLAQS